MYRLLTILISFLFTAHAMRASVAIPYVFVKNYTVDDYKASCQNWGFSLTPDVAAGAGPHGGGDGPGLPADLPGAGGGPDGHGDGQRQGV